MTKKRPPIEDWEPRHLELLRAEARRRDPKALTTLGILYRDGLVSERFGKLVPRNERLARVYIEQAAKLGEPDALCMLADMVSSRKGRGMSQAVRLYRRAFRAGSGTAAYNLACLYQQAGRHSLSLHWFRIAENAGDPAAEFQVALADLYGLGTKRDGKAAVRKLTTIANKRDAFWPESVGYNVQAMLVMADALIRGWLLPRDFDVGISWLRRAAKRGSTSAQALLREYGMTQYVRH